MRRAADGWHAVLRIGAVDHRVWSKDPPVHQVLPFTNYLNSGANA